jgi:hypothetical protein
MCNCIGDDVILAGDRPARVVVEAVLLSADKYGVRFRMRSGRLRSGAHPDEVARRLAGRQPGGPAGLLHSTSWRVEHGSIVLTYAALPDPVPDWAIPVVSDGRAPVSEDPLAPCPAGVRPVDVAAHACRHLAYLRRTDHLVASCAEAAPELWDHLDRFTPAVAGLIG